MSGRRIGRKRLHSLNKLGQTSDNTSGPGIVNAIVSNTVRREGHKIVTEIAIDLGTSKATIACATTGGDIIGVSGGGAAYLTQLTPAVNGYITNVEMVCLEAPTSGINDIDLFMASEATGVFDGAIGDLTETVLITAGGAWALGEIDHYATTHGTAHDIGADNMYLYLTNGGSGTAANYAAGKLCITLEGWAAADDK